MGEDILGCELGRRFPREVAQIMFPVTVKSWLFKLPPVQWLGGQVQELHKTKGSTSQVASFREVMLGNMFGKKFSKCLRKDAKQFLDDGSLSTQFGSGIGGGGTDVAHLYLRGLADFAKHKKLCCACIFIDVKTAFASLIREVAMSNESDVETLVDFLF